jgi:hypothetical protein
LSIEAYVKGKIKQNTNSIGRISIELGVWPPFLDKSLKDKGELRKMNDGPYYFVWDRKNKMTLALFNMDSPVSTIYIYIELCEICCIDKKIFNRSDRSEILILIIYFHCFRQHNWKTKVGYSHY